GTGGRAARRGWRKAVRGGVLAVALGCGAWAVASRWDEVAAGVRELTPRMVAASPRAWVGALLGARLAWRPLPAGRGARLPRWDEVAAGFRELTPAMVAASLAAVLGALLGAMLTWRTLLADLGTRLPVRSAARVFFVGQLGKYIPGTVWPLIAQMEMGRDLGVPRARSAAAFFLMMPVQLATGLLVAF